MTLCKGGNTLLLLLHPCLHICLLKGQHETFSQNLMWQPALKQWPVWPPQPSQAPFQNSVPPWNACFALLCNVSAALTSVGCGWEPQSLTRDRDKPQICQHRHIGDISRPAIAYLIPIQTVPTSLDLAVIPELYSPVLAQELHFLLPCRTLLCPSVWSDSPWHYPFHSHTMLLVMSRPPFLDLLEKCFAM